MTDAPISADLLIKHAWIVTMDAQRHVYRDGAIAIAADRIVAVGPSAEVERQVLAKEIIDGTDRFVVTPGFVNCHIHITGEPITRGYVPDNTDWRTNVFEWLIPTYMAQTPEQEQISARLAALEMLRTGTTCFVEAGTILNIDAVMEALAETGIRGRLGQWLQDRAFAPDDDQAKLTADAIARMEAQQAAYPVSGDPLLATWPCLVGHNTATDDLWRAATDLARESGTGVTAHMSADPADPEFYLETTGRRAIAHLADLGALGPHLSLTHAVYLDEEEVSLLAESGTSVTHCPMTAMKGGYGATAAGSFPEMAAAGVNIQLGTDGNNNGNAADMMRAMFVTAGLFKDARRDTSLFSSYRVLEMGTLNGARGAQLGETIGALAPGMKADFVLHDRDRPEWRPLFNAVNQLIYSADGRGVHSVWVDGRRVVDNYHSTLIDEEKLFAEAEAAGKDVLEKANMPIPSEWPVI
ncbi:cytosine/adenosine deaminase-related metal-dependent hydrolase [Altererythrobacter atlanticus]|uniref:Atrazine chlorohydrolase n=1 Tax=Croceibacterium atlanticum TaxID=1267766 RepID=A0A0F7KU00_9SPHN|nr:amidohydrolase family protein [Croceibacterium atlanticum]AKH42631.1 Atrazine chlorohydrolase [Croceibacterium atlanticum]MBB5731408.1 cytosine/adenosine deaminase-related metal-dependent hydrolase [Croceibacterium atlanticum]